MPNTTVKGKRLMPSLVRRGLRPAQFSQERVWVVMCTIVGKSKHLCALDTHRRGKYAPSVSFCGFSAFPSTPIFGLMLAYHH